MKTIIKKIGIISIACFCVLSFIQPVLAASYSVSASASTIYIGNSVTLTISGSVTGYVEIEATNASLSASSVWIEESSETITVTPKSVGTCVVTITPIGDGLVDQSYETTKAVKTVTITAISQPSSDSSSSSGSGSGSSTVTTPTVDLTLESLSVSQGTLSPEFSATNLTYSVDVTSDVEEIEISAQAVDADSVTIDGLGTHTLVDKDKEFEIVVSDSSNNTKTYTINVYREPEPSVYLAYNSQSLGVVVLDRAPILTNFETTTITYNGEEIEAYYNTVSENYVLYMIDEDGNYNFYLYDIEEETITSKYTPIALLGNNYAMIDVPQEIQEKEGFTFATVIVEDIEFEGLVYNDSFFENYCLIYLMDEMGNIALYQYESTQNTLQLYADGAPITQETYALLLENEEMMKVALAVCGGIACIFAISTLGLLLNRNKVRKELRKVKLQVRNEGVFESND